jgi:hypothetical protein
MHNASIHQRLTAFEPIVNTVYHFLLIEIFFFYQKINHRNEHIVDDILLHLVTILYENSPELVTSFLTEERFWKRTNRKFSKKNFQTNNLIKKIENKLKQ